MLNWAFWKPFIDFNSILGLRVADVGNVNANKRSAHVTVSMYQQSKCSYFEDVHQSYFHAFNLLFYPLAIPKISDIFDDLFNPHIKSRLSTREWQLSF